MTKRYGRGGSPGSWIPGLDGVRGIAILMVMLYHFGGVLNGRSNVQHIVKSVSQLGWIGVDLFFVLSGFLITGILLDSQETQNYFSNFYIRRSLRIFPLYFFSFLVVSLVLPHLQPPRSLSLSALKWNFFYVQNWRLGSPFPLGHYWSLGVEEQFYLAWPLIAYKLPARRLLYISTGLAVFSMTLRYSLLTMKVDSHLIYINTFTRMDALAIGAVCACVVRDAAWARTVRPGPTWKWLAFAPLAILSLLNLLLGSLDNQAASMQLLGFTAIALAFGALLMAVVLTKDSPSMQLFFASTPLRAIGKYSYGAYIWHQLVRLVILELERRSHARVPALLNVAILIAATLLVSICVYWMIERPFLSLKRFFQPGTPLPKAVYATSGG